MELRTARQKRKLTQEQLAELSGLPQTTISDIERGAIKKPSWEAVSRIAKALECSPEEIFPVDNDPKAVAP
jgi:transcriptional regulator with XRE-family HTH domain